MSVNSSNRVLLSNYLLGQHSGSVLGKNYVKNSMAVQNVVNVSANGTATVSRNTSSALTSISDFAITLPNNATDYIEWAMDTIDNALSGQNCEFRFDYNASSLGSNVEAAIIEGSTTISSVVISTANKTVSLNAPCGTAPSRTVRIRNGSGNTGTSALNVANVSYGRASNIGSVAQAYEFASASWTGATSCIWTHAVSSVVPTSYTANASCNNPTVTGNAAAPATKIPAITLNNMASGSYYFYASGLFTADINRSCTFFLYDGTTSYPMGTSIGTNASPNTSYTSVAGNTNFISARVNITSPLTNKTFEIQGIGENSSASCQIYADSTPKKDLKIWVQYLPSQSQLAVSSAQTDYDWTSYGTTSDFTGFGTVSNIQLQHSRVGSNLMIRGKFTSGISTATEARIALPSGLVAADTVKIPSIQIAGKVNTNANAATYFSGGTVLIEPSVAYFTFGRESSTANGLTKVQGSTMTVSGDLVSFFATIPIQGWTTNQRSPTLVGSVTSNASGAERIERATFSNNGSVCSITSQSGSWITSVTRNGTGRCDVVYPSGTFSSAPTCTATSLDTGSRYVSTNTPTTTGVSLFHIITSALGDGSMSLICMGAR
jgi:hypothetical protein